MLMLLTMLFHVVLLKERAPTFLNLVRGHPSCARSSSVNVLASTAAAPPIASGCKWRSATLSDLTTRTLNHRHDLQAYFTLILQHGILSADMLLQHIIPTRTFGFVCSHFRHHESNYSFYVERGLLMCLSHTRYFDCNRSSWGDFVHISCIQTCS